MLLSRASKWAGKIKSREPFGGTVSDLGDWSLEGGTAETQKGMACAVQPWGSVVLKCSRMD